MGASLSLGRVRDGNLVCPYHHFAFCSTGGCAHVPSLASHKIPGTLAVDSYPTESRYGLIWVYLGDEAEEERSPLVRIPEFEDSGFRRLYSEYTWRGSLRPMVENLIDFTHFSYLHADTFGNGNHPFRDDYQVRKGEYEVSCTVFVKLSEANPVFPEILDLGKNPDVRVHSRFHMPSVVVNDFSVGPYKDVTMFTFTPVDECTVVFGMMGVRNFNQTDEHDSSLKDLGNRILEEDRVVIESCVPEILPRQVAVPVDKYLLACRNLYDRYLKNGRSVERHVFTTLSGERITVIPSPVRRSNPPFGKRWQKREDEERAKDVLQAQSDHQESGAGCADSPPERGSAGGSPTRRSKGRGRKRRG